jgi:hypothetical protein
MQSICTCIYNPISYEIRFVFFTHKDNSTMKNAVNTVFAVKRFHCSNFISSKRNIQDHHDTEAYRKEDGADIGMFSL